MFDKQKFINLTDKYLKYIKENPIDNLSFEEAKRVYKDLIDIINFHNYLYYVEANPIISDYEYDQLFHYLQNLEKKYPSLISPDSPTQRLTFQVQKEFKTARHKVPLLSLENTYNAEDLIQWDEFLKRQLEKFNVDFWSYVVEPKFDGSSVELVYKNGVFSQAITRGDGFVGEDVTENVKTIVNLPMRLKGFDNIEELRIRGEVLMKKSVFERLNKQRQSQGLSLFANPRNAAAGSLRQLDPKVTASRGLIIYVYDLLYIKLKDGYDNLNSDVIKLSDKLVLQTQIDIYNFFEKLGLPIWEKIWYEKDINGVIKICNSQEVLNYFKSQDIEFDGLVIKVNELKIRKLLGSTGHHPRWAVAYKFPAEQVSTKLLSIDFQVGRTGIITPVANLEPVEISGAKISRATLHNFDYIKEKDIRIGDWVWVIRSGEVIPYILGPIIEKRNCEVGDLDDNLNIKLENNVLNILRQFLENIKTNEVINYYLKNYTVSQIICCKDKNILKEAVIPGNINVSSRNEILSYLQSLVKYNCTVKILPPNYCPVCGSQTIKFTSEVYLYCGNINCPAQMKEKLKHFVSKDCMDIQGLGDKFIDLLVDNGLVKHFADIYKLKNPEKYVILLRLPLMGEKRVMDLLKEIEESKRRYLWRLINALGIRYVGKKTAKILEKAIVLRLLGENTDIIEIDLTNEFDPEKEVYNLLKKISTLDKNVLEDIKNVLLSFDVDKFINYLTDINFVEKIYGIGDKTVKSLNKYLTNTDNVEIIKELYQVGVNFNYFEIIDELNNINFSSEIHSKLPLEGIHFSITGKFNLPRSKIVKILENYGAIWDEQPKKNTDFILVGIDPGSKLQKAQKYGIKIINNLSELEKLYGIKISDGLF